MAHHARRNSSPPLMPASLGGGPTVFKNCDARGSRQNLGRYARIRLAGIMLVNWPTFAIRGLANSTISVCLDAKALDRTDCQLALCF